MRNHLHVGLASDYVAPTGGVVGGKTYKKGALLHVASSSALEGETYSGDRTGVFTLDAQTSQAWTQGDVLYWDDTAKVWTKTTTGNTKGGIADADKLAAAATGAVLLITSI